MKVTEDDCEPTAASGGQADSTDLMAKLRPDAVTGAPLARARVLGALFGERSTMGTFGRFRVLERLGAGGMGVVYEAYDPDLARGVALKLVNVPAKDRETALAEARALARLSHPNVVPIYDVGLDGDHVYLVMELVRGKTLREWSQGQKLHEILLMYQQAGVALAAAHNAGLVHGDFKPENAIVGTDGRVRVVDFGLARSIGLPLADREETPEVAHTGRLAGTLRYMAPEQLTARPLDARCDQFAFAVALWETLYRAHPFIQSATSKIAPSDLLLRIARGPATPEPRAVPSTLEAALRRALSPNPIERWPTMDALLAGLAKQRPRRGRRLTFAIAGVAVGVAALYAGSRGSPSLSSQSCGKRSQIESIWNAPVRTNYLGQSANTDDSRADAGWFDWYVRRLDAEYAAACPAGGVQRIACLDDAVEDLRTAMTRTDRTHWPRLRALDRCGTTLRELDLGSLNNGEQTYLSADGRQLLLGVGGPKPIIRQLDGSGTRPIDLAIPLKWLPDGSIVGQDNLGRVAVFDPASNRTTRTFDVGGRAFDVSSDLRDVALVAGDKLSIVPIAGGGRLVEPIGVTNSWLSGRFSPDGRRFAVVVVDKHTLYIDDLVSRHREAVALRLHHRGTGVIALRWLDPTSIVVSELAGDLWRVTVDATGHLVEPPQILQPRERDTDLIVHDVQAGKLLIQRVVMAAQNLVVDGESSALLPSWASQLYPRDADRVRPRVLAAIDKSRTRWVWMSLDLARIDPIAALDDLRDPAVSPWGIAALDTRNEPPVYVALDEAGAVLARVPIEPARGAHATLRCSASGCLVRWSTGSVAYTARIEGRTISAPVRHDQLASQGASWELAPDGKLIVEWGTATLPSDGLMLYDIDHSVARRVTSEACKHIQIVRFTPDGDLLLSGISPLSESNSIFVLVRRDARDRERLLLRRDAWIGAIVPLDDHRLIVSTISFQSTLVLFDTNSSRS